MYRPGRAEVGGQPGTGPLACTCGLPRRTSELVVAPPSTWHAPTCMAHAWLVLLQLGGYKHVLVARRRWPHWMTGCRPRLCGWSEPVGVAARGEVRFGPNADGAEGGLGSQPGSMDRYAAGAGSAGTNRRSGLPRRSASQVAARYRDFAALCVPGVARAAGSVAASGQQC